MRKTIGAFSLGLLVGGLACVVVLKHTDRIVQGAMVVREDQDSATLLFNHDATEQTIMVKVPVQRFPTTGGKGCGVAVTVYEWPEFDGLTDELMQINAFELEKKSISLTWR